MDDNMKKSLAQDKVLILYVLNNVKNNVTESDLFKLISPVNNINYFYFKQILADLVDSKLVQTYTKDEDTSGAIIVAKNDKAHIALSEQLKNHEVKKTYIALVRGIIKENEATINMPIARSKKDRKKMDVDKDGKEAITHFKVLGRYKDKYTLLQINLETGRTHQIRVHLSEIGYPVVGDTVYSNGKNEWGIKGQCLHAKSLKFKHPITGKEMFIEAPLPKYFENILKDVQ